MELHADRVLLRSTTTAAVVSIHDLVDDVDTTFADERLVAGDDCGVLIDDLTGGERTAWLDKVGHVREVLTSYRSGFCEDPEPGNLGPCIRRGSRCPRDASRRRVSSVCPCARFVVGWRRIAGRGPRG